MQHTHSRSNLTLLLAGILMLAMFLAGPIAQPAGYHHFADQRMIFGIPNAADVLSNLGFLMAGLAGLVMSARAPADEPGRLGYRVFCISLLLTAAGSGWYHLAPDDTRLAWDRLPIALACMALLAAELQRSAAVRVAPPLLVAGLCLLGVASVGWWMFSADLRPYLLVQLAPLVLIPALQWQSGAPLARRKAFGIAIVLYVLAKAAEVGDGAVLDALAVLSGHTLKHLLAIMAALVLVRQYARELDPR